MLMSKNEKAALAPPAKPKWPWHSKNDKVHSYFLHVALFSLPPLTGGPFGCQSSF